MKRIAITLSILSALFVSCQSNGPEPEPEKRGRKDIVLTKAEQEINRLNNVFAFNLLRKVSQDAGPEGNLLLSPLSVSLAIAMLNNGAEGQTLREIQETLGYGDLTRDEMNGYFQKMLAAIKEADTEATFEIANSIWIRENFVVKEAFKDVNRKYYGAEVRNEDFDNPQTVRTINDWCAAQTHDKIPEFIDKIDASAVMYLINALYFKASWAFQFDKDATASERFTNSDGSQTHTSVMNLEESLVHGEGETFDLLELPYGNATFSMIVLLPKEGVSLSSVVEALNAGSWEERLSQMYEKKVNLKLPRFKIEYEKLLNEELKAMGMESMFIDGAADFSLIHDAELVVSEVRQKTFAQVNEEGTEAAAVTGVVLVPTSTGAPAVSFHATRPFLYIIREQSTGALLFTGAMQHV